MRRHQRRLLQRFQLPQGKIVAATCSLTSGDSFLLRTPGWDAWG